MQTQNPLASQIPIMAQKQIMQYIKTLQDIDWLKGQPSNVPVKDNLFQRTKRLNSKKDHAFHILYASSNCNLDLRLDWCKKPLSWFINELSYS